MEQIPANYDEDKVPEYTLPDPLTAQDGTPVTDAEDWMTRRRPELVALFEHHVYGKTQGPPKTLAFEVTETSDAALGGTATRKQVTVRFSADTAGPAMHVLIYLPSPRSGPVPLFVGLNFHGNHTIRDDPAIALSTAWMWGTPEMGIENNHATDASRGKASARWPVEMILRRGYGLATITCGDLDPDFHDGFANGIHPLFPRDDSAGDAWATISAWAWGLSRALDAFETDVDIDAARVAVIGHSRLGKTALWAGATDPRFALVISNDSGCGGAAISRRRIGESVRRINTTFPHWFCTNYKQYNDNEAAQPIDQHELIALVAPRPVYVASAAEDLWSDPRGEFLAAKAAAPVYKLLGTEGLPIDKMPPLHTPAHGRIGYHIRAGKHNITEYDWAQYLDFADKHLGTEE